MGIGIAILNIGMPTLVSEKFSQQPGLYTMRYCAAIVVGAIVLVLLAFRICNDWLASYAVGDGCHDRVSGCFCRSFYLN